MSRRRAPLVALLSVAGGSLGCVPQLAPGVDGSVERAVPASDTLQLTYLGSGGWIFQRGPDMVMTGPLYTNPSFLGTGLSTIRSDTAEVDRHMAAYDVRATKAILVGHAHYDHLMDVPRVAKRHAPDARIVGSTTVRNTLGSWSGLMDRVDLAEPFAGDAEDRGRWMSYGPRVRVLPLRSWHAPHFDGMTLYRGTVDRPLTREPLLAGDWVDGQTFAFLMDFLDDDGSVAWRVYYQDAVTAAPWGFAPESVIAERPVDVAIFVPATFDQVDWHPEAFIENLQPRRVLLGHWEDFFVDFDAPTRSVMLSDIGYFEKRLERVFEGEWWRPEKGTDFRFGR